MIYLAIAYVLIAVVLVAYGWSIYRRAQRVDRQRHALSDRD